jgi:hypothetical protein
MAVGVDGMLRELRGILLDLQHRGNLERRQRRGFRFRLGNTQWLPLLVCRLSFNPSLTAVSRSW